MKFRNLTVIALLGAFVSAAPVPANEMSEARDALCEKIKGCALEQMGQADNMTDQMKTMIMQSLESMCDGLEEGYKAAEGHPLYQPATACMRSMSEQSCEVLQQGDDMQTPECASFREESKKYE